MDQTNIIKRLGGPSQVAKMLGITVAAVSAWRGRIPPLRVLQLSQITGLPVSEIATTKRPDIWPKDEDAA